MSRSRTWFWLVLGLSGSLVGCMAAQEDGAELAESSAALSSSVSGWSVEIDDQPAGTLLAVAGQAQDSLVVLDKLKVLSPVANPDTFSKRSTSSSETHALALVARDSHGVALARYEMTASLITEPTFPALDPSGKDAAFVRAHITEVGLSAVKASDKSNVKSKAGLIDQVAFPKLDGGGKESAYRIVATKAGALPTFVNDAGNERTLAEIVVEGGLDLASLKQ